MKVGKTDQEVFNGIKARVVAAVPNQVPWMHDGLVGPRVVFNPGRTQAPAPPPAGDGLTFTQQAEMAFWNSVRDSRDPAIIRTYLKKFPEGTFAELAVALIDAIEKDRRQSAQADARQAELRQAEAERTQADARRQEAEKRAAMAEAAKQKEALKDAQQKLAAAQEAARIADQKRREAEKAAQSAQALAQDQRKEREEREKAERLAEEAWLKVHATNDVRSIEEFLRSHANSSLVEAARQKLAALATPSDSRRDTAGSGQGQGATQGQSTGDQLRYAIKANLATASVMRALAVAPNRRELAVAGDDGIVRLFALPSFRLVRQFPDRGTTNAIKSISYSGDGTVLIAGRKNGAIELWRTDTGEMDRTLSGGVGSVSAVGYYQAALNRYAVAAGPDGIEIWNIRTDRVAGRPGLHDGEVKTIAYTSKQTGDFVSGGADGQVVFYLPGNRQKPVAAHKGAVFAAAVSSQNEMVATAGADGLVKVWHFESQRLLNTSSGHSRYVLSVAFDAAGTRLASGGADTSVRVWSAKDGKPLAELKGHQKDVEAVAFVDQDDHLVSISEDKTLRLWSLKDGKALLTVVLYADGEIAAITETGKYFGSRSAVTRLEIVENGRVRALTSAEVASLRIEDFSAAR